MIVVFCHFYGDTPKQIGHSELILAAELRIGLIPQVCYLSLWPFNVLLYFWLNKKMLVKMNSGGRAWISGATPTKDMTLHV